MKLYNGDCLEIMKNIPDDSIDLILCDLPYGTIKGLQPSKYKKKFDYNTDWDIRLDTESLFREYERILRPKGTIILFSQEPYTNQLRAFECQYIKFSQSAIWKKDAFGNFLGCKNSLVSYYEDISIFRANENSIGSSELKSYFKKVKDYINLSLKQIENIVGHRKLSHCFLVSDNNTQFRLCVEEAYNDLINIFHIDQMDGFLSYSTLKDMRPKSLKPQTFNLEENENFIGNIFEYNRETKRYHPTQKPVALLERLIKIYSNEGETVLDNCMGSGSTGVACLNTSRKFIGIEKDENYFQIAKERLEETNSKLEQSNKEISEEQSQIEAFF